MLTQNELKALWKETGFRPLKRFGQNFLIDKNIRDKILRQLEISPDDTVLEIGPGFGELTASLAGLAKRVIAVEVDHKLSGILRKKNILSKNVDLVEKDILKFDFESLTGNKKIIVYGNLPYYITSPILEKFFKKISLVKCMYLVMQKEVAERILAKPGSKSIGRLSLFAQYYTDPSFMFVIGKNSFYPVPDVDSVMLKLDVPDRGKLSEKEEDKFFKVIKMAYSQRRKNLLNSLSGTGYSKDELSQILMKAGIDPNFRAENLSIEDFMRLSALI
ncbi:MAG: 16S rRNA (adenine(1518)-N(6)/adenine(1519)-N(6))-dimethyltransferase RsmA [Candidatus Omnitrophota bacterium]